MSNEATEDKGRELLAFASTEGLGAGAEARPIRVFKLDDSEWWAGESLEACVAEGQRQFGDDFFRPDEFDQYELSEGAMCSLRFIDEDGGERSFASELARRIAAGEKFPQQFSSEDW